MLLAIDAGNTNITIGLFEGERLLGPWRLRTVRDRTADEWGVLVRQLFDLAGVDTTGVAGIVIASVVPSLDAAMASMAEHYFGQKAHFVQPANGVGMKILYDNPAEVGADRVVNGVAAFEKYGGPCIVVDLGTAITFDVISARGEYLGGIISVGIGIAMEALFSKTARLPQVGFQPPAKLIGANTVDSMQSGLYYGALGTIDGIVERLLAELGPETKVVATGGHATVLAGASRYLKHVDEHLTLEGLRLIFERKRP